MIYLFNLLILVYLSKFLIGKYNFIFAIFLSILPSLQYNTGTDYESYIRILENKDDILQFFYKDEYISYFIFYFLNNYSINPQFLFIIFAFLTAFFFTKSFSTLKITEINVAVLVFLFVCVTGIYHNQFNLIRNYFAFSILFYAILQKFSGKIYYAIFLVCLSTLIHFSSIFFFFLILLPNKIFIYFSKNIYLGILIQILLIILIFLIQDLLNFIDFQNLIYSNYILTYHDINFDKLISKSIYFPIFIYYALFIHSRIKSEQILIKYFIGIWSISFMLPLIGSFHEIGLRINTFTGIFIIFPLYLVLKYSSFLIKYIIYSYIFFIYLYKILIFSKFEYNYNFISI